jgi:hypothetical protein
MIDLIPFSYLNDVCFLSLNTNDKKYRMCLKMSQDTLKDILGRSFYEQIETQYQSSTLTTDNNTLYTDYLKDFLAWQTYFNYLKFANIEATPTGIRQFEDENSTVADDIKMFSLEKNVLAEANKKKFNITNFLRDSRRNNSSIYPLWVDRCRTEMAFAITSVDKCSDALIKVNKSIITQE